ncbi:MAG TPA: YqeG family HAD IIIA-type phosphatase [Fimbriimonadaceae bacterium]|nr:YqeG family HAD IIIA-type phosphatase [Fimbriimonadaceae bacterium]
MPFRIGSFERDRLMAPIRPFCPAEAVQTLADVNLEGLWNRGKRLLLLDVDNTLVKYLGEDFEQPVMDWIARAKQMGFDICIISNTNRVERLQRIRELLGVETVRGKFKPSRAMFRLALIKFQRKPQEAIMIGDQLFTDVLGANRAGIEAIWVEKMEGPEFGPTALISRTGERFLRSLLYRVLITSPIEKPDRPEIEQQKPLFERTIVRQFLKFCVVGGSSFIIDFTITYLLVRVVSYDGVLVSERLGNWLIANFPTVFLFASRPSDAAVPIFTAVAAAVAIFNSFIWNRRWTFQIRGKEERLAQLRRFYLVSVIGMLLNVLITTALNTIIPGHPNRSLAVAKVVAAAVVAVWNFTGQRLYAFKPRLRANP